MRRIVIDNVTKRFRSGGRSAVAALDAVSWEIGAGKISGLVGESGSGKTTLVRCMVGLDRVDSGRILYGDEVLQPGGRSRRRRMRRQIQLVFQDPTGSLNPRMTVGQLIGEGLAIHHLVPAGQRASRVAELMEMVGLDPRDSGRYPRSFSGGQRQRVAIARALAVEPEVLICDEPVSALDVSVQAQVLGVLRDMQQRLGLTILLVAHDLAVVQSMCSDIAVIEHGRIVETGPADQVMTAPQATYTRSLIEAVPVPDPALARAKARYRRTGADRTGYEPPDATTCSESRFAKDFPPSWR